MARLLHGRGLELCVDPVDLARRKIDPAQVAAVIFAVDVFVDEAPRTKLAKTITVKTSLAK